MISPPIFNSSLLVARIIARSRARRESAVLTPRKIQKMLGKLSGYMVPEKAETFHTYLAQVIFEAVGLKTGLSPNSLTVDIIKSKLRELRFSDATIDRLAALVEHCNFARYAAASSANTRAEMKKLYDEARQLVSILF